MAPLGEGEPQLPPRGADAPVQEAFAERLPTEVVQWDEPDGGVNRTYSVLLVACVLRQRIPEEHWHPHQAGASLQGHRQEKHQVLALVAPQARLPAWAVPFSRAPHKLPPRLRPWGPFAQWRHHLKQVLVLPNCARPRRGYFESQPALDAHPLRMRQLLQWEDRDAQSL